MAARLLARFLLFGLLAAGLAGAPPALAAEDAPVEIVERLNQALIGVMREAETLGFQGRYDRLAPVLTAAFDFPLMARVSIGRHWRKLDEDARARFVNVFGRMSIATFAARFDGYGGERFEVVGEKPAPRKAVLVRNNLIKNDGETVAIDYLFKAAPGNSGGGWRVVDVFLDGKFSELAMKRSEYSSVFKNHGFEKLMQSLDEKIAALAATN